MTTKPTLLSQLENAKNNFVLGLAAISLFANPEAFPLLEKSHVEFGKYKVPFKQVSNLLATKADREIAIKEFARSQLRALIKESFELIKDYCGNTDQSRKFEAEPWYQFARLMRNCLSHSGRFEFSRYDKGKLPITWETRTIDAALDRQSLKLNFFGWIQAWELFEEFEDFVNNRLD